MKEEILYIKAERNIEVQKETVLLKDMAKMTCTNSHVLSKAKALKVYQFTQDGPKRQIISIVKIIEMLQSMLPNVTVENLGETDTVIEKVDVNEHKGFLQGIKIVFVSFISFFGTAFTISAYHNDVGIVDVFYRVYELVMGQKPDGFTILEVSYSIGLAVGIIIFFNHIGGRRITKDPTPIEVEMRIYENEVNTALVETADREELTIDVD
ncbi:MAG: stage V sporulation protein AA [Lachnospiraceae bacterium]|nr:stage V sporulation protein AA [Lachnospiraceae bacterium]